MPTYPSDIKKLIATIEEKQLSISEATEIIKNQNSGKLFDPLSEPLLTINNEILLTVNYDMPLEQLIKDGDYHWANSDINIKNYPNHANGHKGEADVLAKIFTFDPETLGEQALAQMYKASYAPANLTELLTLGITHPQLQRLYSIMSPGSIWRFIGMPNTPYLGTMKYPDGQKRHLSTGWFVPRCKIRESLLGIQR